MLSIYPDPPILPVYNATDETPVQWGQIDFAIFRSQIGNPPGSLTDDYKKGPTWFFVTRFSISPSIDGVDTGYAIYIWKDELDDWRRFIVSFNNKPRAQAAFVSAKTSFEPTSGIYCIRQLQLNK